MKDEKIALYLGSFNPFHNGHLKVVKSALNDFKMDKVIIVPTMQNPWKNSESTLDFNKRIYIVRAQLQNEFFPKNWTHIGIDNIEKFLTPPYYSYATLHALKNKYCNNEIYVLCGEDTIKDIPNWMNGEAIIQDYDFLIVDRPEGDISSSEIRDKIKNNESIKGLVPDSCINLINNYYK